VAYYSKRSLDRLFTCDAQLIELCMELVRHRDNTVVWGHRNEEQQNALVNHTPPRSRLSYPDSAHNKMPSRAVDLQPHPMTKEMMNDREMWMMFRGQVYGIASMLGIQLKPTIEWDLYHFELED